MCTHQHHQFSFRLQPASGCVTWLRSYMLITPCCCSPFLALSEHAVINISTHLQWGPMLKYDICHPTRCEVREIRVHAMLVHTPRRVASTTTSQAGPKPASVPSPLMRAGGCVVNPPAGPFGTTTAELAAERNHVFRTYDEAATFLGWPRRLCTWTGSWWSPMVGVAYGDAPMIK